jgi:hypothetical protein
LQSIKSLARKIGKFGHINIVPLRNSKHEYLYMGAM